MAAASKWIRFAKSNAPWLNPPMESVVQVNGKISDGKEAVVSVFDRGFLFGDGVYETGRTYQRCPLFLEEHLARFRSSASLLKIPVPWTDSELKHRLFETGAVFNQADAYFRMILTRGLVEHVGLDQLDQIEPTLVVIFHHIGKAVARVREQGVHVLTSKIVRNSPASQDPNIKTSNYLNSLLALQDVRDRGAQDGILCNADGFVTEGTTFSVFGIDSNGDLLTPSLQTGILDSITRRHVIAHGRKMMRVHEGEFTLERFLSCREAFWASSVREIVPIREWDGRQFPVPGELTKKLHEQLRIEIAGYVEKGEKF